MKEKKGFLKGCLFGIVITILLNTIVTKGIQIYKRYTLQEISSKQKLSEINYIIDKYYVDDVTEEQLLEGMYYGMVESLNDPYSYYMDKDTFEQFLEETNGNYVGIGIIVTLDTSYTINIVNVFEGSPAEEKGLLPNDKIIKVEDTEVGFDNYSEAVSMIKGEEGSVVNLTIFRESENQAFEIAVPRRSIDVPTVSYEILQDNIGYIKITQFEGVTFEQFEEAFNYVQEQNTKGLILDLRDNPGGLLNTVVQITDLLVPEGIITYIEDKNGEKTYQYSDANYYDKPLVILVNGNSASASEVLSGAVKDLGIAKLVGETTYGKGVVQNIYQLSDGSGVKVTIAKYYTPSGVCIDGTGIEPDYPVVLDENVIYNSEDDTQLYKAIDVINNWK